MVCSVDHYPYLPDHIVLVDGFQVGVGSPWLLTPPFYDVLDNLSLRFFVRGSKPGFLNGRYEGNQVVTAPVAKRKGRIADYGEVMVFLSILPSSLSPIPVKYLQPYHPGPGEEGVVIEGEAAGLVLDINDQHFPGDMLLGRM